MGTWAISSLRKYGLVDGKFCFEGGSGCGRALEGPHVLSSQQPEDLSRAFDLASNGKLAAVRRAELKKAQLSEMARMAATPHCGRKRAPDSAESSRPLLLNSSSGSDGSGGSACDCHSSSDEAYSSKSTCCTSLRWSSISSACSGRPLGLGLGCSAQSLVEAPPDGELNKLNDNHRCVFSFSSCGRLVKHFRTVKEHALQLHFFYRCGRNFCPAELEVSSSCSVQTISTLLSELRSNSPRHTSTPSAHYEQICPQAGQDRSSLCSSSSTSSGGSSCYQSEYSAHQLRSSSNSLADQLSSMLYDRPRTLLRRAESGCNCSAPEERVERPDCKTPVNMEQQPQQYANYQVSTIACLI